MTNPAIKCESVSKQFGTTEAVRNVSLEVPAGRTLALLGPSGCGKTTLLRLIAGFERPDAGRILIRDREVVGPKAWVPPEKRHIGFVFQDYALFPHLTVGANIAFGLNKLPRGERGERVEACLDLVGLIGLGERMPHELSGGQQQRVALARALAPDPDLVLLDEPFSNLDADRRLQVREELKRILKVAKATAIFVTHDREEALNLGDDVAVMDEGRIVETGPAREVYLHPKSKEAAGIVGSANILHGESMGVTVKCAIGQLPVAHPCRLGEMDILIRPESIRLNALTPGSELPKSGLGVVSDLQYHGNHQHVRVRLSGGEELRVKVGPEQMFLLGQRVQVQVPDPVICYEAANKTGPESGT